MRYPGGSVWRLPGASRSSSGTRSLIGATRLFDGRPDLAYIPASIPRMGRARRPTDKERNPLPVPDNAHLCHIVIIEGIDSCYYRQASRKLLLTGERLQVETSCPRFTRSPERLGCTELGFHQEAFRVYYTDPGFQGRTGQDARSRARRNHLIKKRLLEPGSSRSNEVRTQSTMAYP